MTEHEIHHRGQIYLYLGILGVPTPPIFGLTSEEVRACSSQTDELYSREIVEPKRHRENCMKMVGLPLNASQFATA
jgi:hypothetical protein